MAPCGLTALESLLTCLIDIFLLPVVVHLLHSIIQEVRIVLNTARLRLSFKARASIISNPRKKVFLMSVLNSLYVGIDVSKNSNQVYAMNFNQKKLLSFSVSNDSEGASKIESKLIECLNKNNYDHVVIVLESTGMYSFHIATYLSASELLTKYSVLVYCINPKTSQNYRKSFTEMDKTDPKDSYILADMARAGKIKKLTPVKGPQKLALQRLTRHRKHISDQIVREKLYVLNNIFLKFSAFDRKYDGFAPFSDPFSATAQAILLEYKSPEEIINTPIEDLTSFISTTSKNRFADSKKVAETLTKCARMSYRLDKSAYEPINTAIASSLAILRCLENEMKQINKEIENLSKGFNSDEYNCLISIPGIGPTFAAGILSEIGSIKQFDNEEGLAKFAGLTWRRHQSADDEYEDTPMTKTGNSYLRYYLIEAAIMAVHHNPVYKDYYQKKYAEVKTHKHTRAIALTARKLVRLIYGLLSKNQLYKAN